MARLDAPELSVNPAAFAAGAPGVAPDASGGPACQLAKASYWTALGFRILFTLLVVAISVAAAGSLVWAVYKLVKDGADAGAIIAGVTGVLESGAAAVLAKRMTEAIAVERDALDKVGDHCGSVVKLAIERL